MINFKTRFVVINIGNVVECCLFHQNKLLVVSACLGFFGESHNHQKIQVRAERHDNQHNNIQYKYTQHYDTQNNGTWRSLITSTNNDSKHDR